MIRTSLATPWSNGINRAVWFGLLAAAVGLLGCTSRTSQHEVVVYAALDSEFSQPILKEFAEQTGIAAVPKFDVEATKTVGLVNAIIAESARPRCDVFWNNEILNTIRLKQKGLLEPYRPAVAEQYPPLFRDPDGTWCGFAARARILLVNTQLVPPADRPQSIYDMVDPKWKGRTGIAKPLFGTTATHVACLFAVLGPEKAQQLLLDMKQNGVQIEAGNKQVALAVAAGQLAFGLTDTDDALSMIAAGYPVEIVYPDREQNQLGTLFIPNTVAIIKGCPHPSGARQLVDYVLSANVERQLATGASGQIPLNTTVNVPLQVETPKTVKAMEVDFDQAASAWDAAAAFVRDQFTVD